MTRRCLPLELDEHGARCVRAALLRAAGDRSLRRAGVDADTLADLVDVVTARLRGWAPT